jgi:hypothetical protein
MVFAAEATKTRPYLSQVGAIQNVAPVLGFAFPSFSGMYQRQI